MSLPNCVVDRRRSGATRAQRYFKCFFDIYPVVVISSEGLNYLCAVAALLPIQFTAFVEAGDMSLPNCAVDRRRSRVTTSQR